jgi:uncharacterized protein (DUF4213/DUF364 family)
VQLDDGSVGLAFTLLDNTLRTLRARTRPLTGTAASQLVAGYANGDSAARALGLAAINALTRRLYRQAGFEPDSSVDSFGSLGLAAGDRLGMVGHFSPLIRLREEPGLAVTLDPRRLGGCNKIVATSSLLLNDTFESVASYWKRAESVAIVGPSAGCPPDALFAAGVSAVGTAWVTDADKFLARVDAGEKWGDASRKVTISPEQYPGLDHLLAAGARMQGGS